MKAYYFSHDANARNDLKCIRLRREMGMEGYGIYWAILEIIREENSGLVSVDSIDDIAHVLGVEIDKIKSVIFNYKLFIVQDENFYSERLLKNMSDYNELKIKLSESGRKGGLSRAKGGLEEGLKPYSSNKRKEKKENKGGVGENSKGKKFDVNKKFVYFADGTKQKLGTNQFRDASEGVLQPSQITKSIIY